MGKTWLFALCALLLSLHEADCTGSIEIPRSGDARYYHEKDGVLFFGDSPVNMGTAEVKYRIHGNAQFLTTYGAHPVLLECGHALYEPFLGLSNAEQDGVLASFDVIDENYAVDPRFVYYRGYAYTGPPEGGLRIFEKDARYARDNRSVFFHGMAIEGADPATFAVLTGNMPFEGDVSRNIATGKTLYFPEPGIAADKNSVYWGRYAYKSIHPGSIEVLSRTFFRYGNAVYAARFREEEEKSMKGSPAVWRFDRVDAPSFRVLDTMYFRDKDRVYCGDGLYIVKDADVHGFVVLGEGYARDSTRVFFGGDIVADADPATFEALPLPDEIRTYATYRLAFGRDRSRVYVHQSVIPGQDPKTFDMEGYIKGCLEDAARERDKPRPGL
jgi:hypothetical protein